ncbi:lysozyme inhibitor LprI family protein [Methylobacterium brachythecii]|uniref:Uncharacterized protein YecT (DUF1311 family) n=1 Tax=Methylobacterium brachythecii TaxID=1176177 RepID=A0A7W6ALB2_9HYPH|nr:lysozyme inhibitor LprI family protein [Methylobacterium brachythecii]MBB3904661.1 uncharacterized protein YecT (DUF1311 family) [Methylobacterium brachythecii]GLS44993.1 hypothetical protein GCM10007884_29820 [Methylobacterium brachythecii]
MQRIDDIPAGRGGARAHPAALLALAFGIMIGAYLSSVPARSAEAGTATPEIVGPAPSALGAPKRVQTVRIPVEKGVVHVAAPKVAEWNYDGDAEYRRCVDQSDGTNMAFGACGGALIAREDVRLNAAWKRVYALDRETKLQDLLEEQRAWIRFKDTSCTFYASGSFGPEGQVLSYPVCRAGIIAQRTATLESYESEDNR